MMKHTAKIDEISELVTLGIQPGRMSDEKAPPCGVLTAKNLDHLTVTGEPTLERLRERGLDQYRVRTGDVLMLNRGGAAKVAVVTPDFINTVVGQNLLLIRPGPQVLALYLAGLLRSRAMQNRLAPLYTGTSVQVLSVAKLRETRVPLPDTQTQEKLARLFEEYERYVSATTEAMEARLELMEAVMGRVLGGDI